MRIISGSLKGRKLATSKGRTLRPTSDRVKESMFNILGKEVEGKIVLDLFSGTGNLGIEGLSRGARRVIFVENSREAFKLIERNVLTCGVQDRSEILLRDVDVAIDMLKGRKETFDLIFMDPPYGKGLAQRTIKKLSTDKIYHDDSILVVEHNRREPLSDISEKWNLIRQRRMGDTVISLITPCLQNPLIGHTGTEKKGDR